MNKKSFLESRLPKGNGTHASLVCLVGAYVIYMAYSMIRNTRTGNSTMSMTTTLILAGIMALVGIAVIGYGILIWYGIWKRSFDSQADAGNEAVSSREKQGEEDEE